MTVLQAFSNGVPGFANMAMQAPGAAGNAIKQLVALATTGPDTEYGVNRDIRLNPYPSVPPQTLTKVYPHRCHRITSQTQVQ